MELSNLERMRIEVACEFEFWRRRLLSPKALAKLASDLGLGLFEASEIEGLWRIGLLRADVVTSNTSIDRAGLKKIDGLCEDANYTYCDFRQIQHRKDGYGSSIQVQSDGSFDETLAFHPFRIYVLHHVERTLRMSTSNMQFLTHQPGIVEVAKHIQEGCRSWTSSVSFGERFHYWNEVAETAAISEPLTFDVIFRDRDPLTVSRALTEGFELTLSKLLNEKGKIQLRQMILDLGFASSKLDQNRAVHVLLRLMKWRERENLKGKLGGAMYFLAIAETIRRASERAFSENWPEEDEIGSGQWFPGARKMLYGAERVFDAPRQNLRDYLNQLGLDFGVKARCYVEGDTEFGALTHAIGSFDHVQLVNLSGSIAERNGKGLAFEKSLEADLKAGVFSVIVLDGDNKNYIRILSKAANEGKFHGRFFINEPDIECGNFSSDELIEIAIMESEINQFVATDMSLTKLKMLGNASKIKNNKDLFTLCKENGLTHLRKGESWGKALMEVAISSPTFPLGDAREKKKRPIVEVASLLIRMRDVGFSRSVSAERLDPVSGRMILLSGAQ